MNNGLLYFPRGPDQVLPVAVMGQARGLIVQSDGATPNTRVRVSAEEIVLKSGNGIQFLAADVAVAADITMSGPGGLDAGAEAASTWYYLWLISNGTDVAAALSASASEINLMFGYDYRALLGAVYNDAGSNLVRFWQGNRGVRRVPVTIAGAVGANAIPTAVPPIARTVFGTASVGGLNVKFHGSIAGDVNLVGQIRLDLTTDGVGTALNRPFFEVPLINSQEVYLDTAVTLSIVGFTI